MGADTPRKPRRWPWVLLAILGIPCLLVTGLVTMFMMSQPRYVPDKIMTVQALKAAKTGDEVFVLVDVTGVNDEGIRLRGILLDKTPDAAYQRTTQLIQAFIPLDIVDVIGSFAGRAGDIIQIEGTIDTPYPDIVIRSWHSLLVTDRVRIK